MASIGETLRRERQKRNLELTSVAQELRISVRFLAAIENEEFDKLPGGIFSKSFVRQYAAFLGLDADGLVAEFQNAVEPGEPAPQLEERPKPNVPELRIDGYEGWRGGGGRRTSWSSWVTAAVIVVVVMLVCSAVAWWWERPRRTVVAHENPPAAAPAAATSAAPATATPVPAGTEPVTNQPASAPPAAAAGSATTQPPAAADLGQTPVQNPTPAAGPVATAPVLGLTPAPPPNPNATVRVRITAEQPVWIRASANGKFLFSGTMQPHETRDVDADGLVEVRLGNAGGVVLTLNGKAIAVDGLPAGAAGPAGQVRTVQFTSGGFQIVPPKEPDRDLR